MFVNLGIPRKPISSIEFKTSTSIEVEKLSVKSVTNPKSYTDLMQPTEGGLYDPIYGAISRDEICKTCNLGEKQCTGHMGHIALSVPVYSPTYFAVIHKLLRGSCLNCQKLLVDRNEITNFEVQLKSVRDGMVSSVSDLQDAKNMQTTRNSKNDDEASYVEVRDNLNQVLQTVKDKAKIIKKEVAPRSSPNWSCNASAFEDELRNKFIVLMIKKSKFCCHCGAKTQNVRAEMFSKFYLETENEDDDHSKEKSQNYLTTDSVKKHISALWENEKSILSKIFPAFMDAEKKGKKSVDEKETSSAMDVLFLKNICIPPPRFRPPAMVNDMTLENVQTTVYSKILQCDRTIQLILVKMKENEDIDEESKWLKGVPGKTLCDKFHHTWILMQQFVNCIFDSSHDKNTDQPYGIRQLVDKKCGIMRKNIMGKRVNNACRSVITPDPYIATNEVGLPMVFAKKLTYPRPVTSFNIEKLRQCIINGPEIYPGATHVEFASGRKVIISPHNVVDREALARQLSVPSNDNLAHQAALVSPQIVHRHIENGDVMLLNRQPTLHKGSIMAQKARILPSEKTLRLHYANCKSYNADFDGDEMNCHFPQNEQCRAEALELMLTDHQYLSAKDGKPLSGLMQDHLIGGVRMVLRGQFYTKEKYQQLVYSGLVDHKRPIVFLLPSILKPVALWSGKQIVSTVVLNLIPEDGDKLNVRYDGKIEHKRWRNGKSREAVVGKLKEKEMSESEVVIREGELLSGVMDKASCGASAYGLVHAVNELYGGTISGRLMTSFARLFTCYLQWYGGFTLGTEDIQVVKKANKIRQKTIEDSIPKGQPAMAEMLNIKDKENSEGVYCKGCVTDATKTFQITTN